MKSIIPLKINLRRSLLPVILFALFFFPGHAQNNIVPSEINFVRQGVRRFIFDEKQTIPLAGIYPSEIVGINSMYPQYFYSANHPDIFVGEGRLIIESGNETETGIWFGSFNPFATYVIKFDTVSGMGETGFEFSDKNKKERFIVSASFEGNRLTDARLKIIKGIDTVFNKSVRTCDQAIEATSGELILQMFGSGFNLFVRNKGLPVAFGQADFNTFLDLRKKRYLRTFQSNLYCKLKAGRVAVKEVTSGFSTGIGQADIRAVTFKDGSPYIDNGRLWYTMSIRGRALPHHLQGVFSMSMSAFDLKLEGIIVFDRNDGILRNEISTHLFYDEDKDVWRGLTTGFSAFANEKEKKQILAIESKTDPRFGFSIMKAKPMGMVGDIEDSHILFDEEAQKWRIFTCRQQNGYKAVLLESDRWDSGYKLIAGPVNENSTGTSIQKIGGKRYCFMGSSERKVFIYTYPDLLNAGTLKMDLPPWDKDSGTRIWPNVLELPDSYNFQYKYIGLMMDRYNYPGIKGPNWTYGALYLYYGYDE